MVLGAVKGRAQARAASGFFQKAWLRSYRRILVTA